MRHLMIYLAGVSLGLYFGIVLGGLLMWSFLQPLSARVLPFSMPQGSSLYLMAVSLALHIIALFMIIRFQPREKTLDTVDDQPATSPDIIEQEASTA